MQYHGVWVAHEKHCNGKITSLSKATAARAKINANSIQNDKNKKFVLLKKLEKLERKIKKLQKELSKLLNEK